MSVRYGTCERQNCILYSDRHGWNGTDLHRGARHRGSCLRPTNRGVFLWISATESTGIDHEWAKCTGTSLIGVRCNEWVNNLPDMFVNNPFGTENRSRKPSIYCLKMSNSPTKQSRQVTVTYADESKSMRTVSLKTEQKKRVKKAAVDNMRDKKNGFFDDGLNTFMTTHASRQESRP